MSKKELDESIYRFKRPQRPGFKSGPPQYVSDEIPVEQKGDCLCFDLSGKVFDDEVKCAAKKVVFNNREPRYFIKWCMEGPDKGHPLNPYSIYFREGDEERIEPRRGGMRYEFRMVNEDSFGLYIKFLKTKMASYCQAAERGILNG